LHTHTHTHMLKLETFVLCCSEELEKLKQEMKSQVEAANSSQHADIKKAQTELAKTKSELQVLRKQRDAKLAVHERQVCNFFPTLVFALVDFRVVHQQVKRLRYGQRVLMLMCVCARVRVRVYVRGRVYVRLCVCVCVCVCMCRPSRTGRTSSK
jgi:hypothetical protein